MLHTENMSCRNMLKVKRGSIAFAKKFRKISPAFLLIRVSVSYTVWKAPPEAVCGKEILTAEKYFVAL